MRILALDTALGACSVALLEDGKLRARRYQERTRGHAEALMGLIGEVEDEAGLRSLDCDRLGVTVGPGTFTGLRVGLAAARGLALATGLPLVGITTLQAIAANAKSEEGKVLAILDAKRGEVYSQLFATGSDLAPLTNPEVLTLEVADERARMAMTEEQVTFIGTGAALIAQRVGGEAEALISEASDQPDAAEVARLASLIDDPALAPPEPLYLRAPDAKRQSRNPLA